MIQLKEVKAFLPSEDAIIPEHGMNDLIVVFRRAPMEHPLDDLRGWTNKKYDGVESTPCHLSWCIDATGVMSRIKGNAFTVVLVYSGCTVGNDAGFDVITSTPDRRDGTGAITGAWFPKVEVSGESSKFLFFSNVTNGMPYINLYGHRAINSAYETRVVNGSSVSIMQSNGDNCLIFESEMSFICPDSKAGYDSPAITGLCNITLELVPIGQGGSSSGDKAGIPVPKVKTHGSIETCAGKVEMIGDTMISTDDFENAQDLLSEVGSDLSDPLADEYESYIAAGNNTEGTTGVHKILPTQTTPPTPIPYKPHDENTAQPPLRSAQVSGCEVWTKDDYDVRMSEHFILRNFTIGYQDKSKNAVLGCYFPNKLIDLPSISAQDRFCNLKALAENVLEPLYAKFGQFRINSAIRNQNSVSNGVSQHVLGEAVDIQFPGWSYDRYWQNAPWIRDNLPYDQFIFEHSSKSGSVWLHLSFKRSGNRPPDHPRKVMTMYRGHYDSGLKKYF